MSNEASGKKCIAVHLPVKLLENISETKSKTGKSQNGLIIDLIEKGLGISENACKDNNVLFFVKVRIDVTKIAEFGQKLQNGELDTSLIIMTYCVKDDPTVGVSFWQAESKQCFETVFAQHRVFYKEVLEITHVVTPMDSMKLIMANMKR